MSKRISIFLIIAAGIIGTFMGILQNVASSTIPESWAPYVWIAWPLLVVFAISGIGIAVWQYIREKTPELIMNHQVEEMHINHFQNHEGNFIYDAFVSYANSDRSWVKEVLLPRLLKENLRVSLSDESGDPGVPLVMADEQGIRNAKRTIVVLSPAYLANNFSEFQNILAQTMGIQEGSYRILPIKIKPMDQSTLPVRLGMLTSLDFTDTSRIENEFTRLVMALKSALPINR